MSGSTPVPRLWPGETVVILAGGPSLTAADVDYCRGKARVIAINDAYRLAPWADVLYACDGAWWKHHKGVPGFAGLKFSITAPRENPWNVKILRNDGPDGLCLTPNAVRVGGNSGYQAINVAVHFGAARILLLGYDMSVDGKRTHWFGDHPKTLKQRSSYAGWIVKFPSMLPTLKKLGVEVINCSRRTALKAFPCQPLETALPALALEAVC